MAEALTPSTPDDLCDLVHEAARGGDRLMLCGGDSKSSIGAPSPDARRISLAGFDAIIDYDPAELVLTVGAGARLNAIQALVASEGQMLAFDPFDHAPLFRRLPGAATIGGVISAGVAGSQRLSQGGVRDHLLGFEAVSGRGERFIAGGRVVKNVTGYDLSKLVSGSWGRLAALTQVTIKVLPGPRVRVTKLIHGLTAAEAIALMAVAMGGHAEVAAAAYLPVGEDGGASLTALRVQGFETSVAARSDMLDALIVRSETGMLSGDGCRAFWNRVAIASPLLDHPRPLWRINIPPSSAPALIHSLELGPLDWLCDWAGGLIWAASDWEAQPLRASVKAAGGHAMLVRANETLRACTPALHPPPSGEAALEARVRRAFDPQGLFETGRF